MATTKEALIEAVKDLVEEGKSFLQYTVFERQLSKGTISEKSKEKLDKKPYKRFPVAYQLWYSKASITIKQILPDRYAEFVELYKSAKSRKTVDVINYSISDYLAVLTLRRGADKQPIFDVFNPFFTKLEQQVTMIESGLERLDSILSDIEGTLQARLFDDELSAAADLLKKGHLRSAGALTGVTLERHFTTVAQNHALTLPKKNPTIADFNELFKSNGIYDIPTYRFIQRLADIRNIATHFKGREPTKIEIDEMIKGTDKILKTVF
ncbi:MAG TPA: hypothetical protein VIL74_03765 [Pyrinomonadaceae bacterium]|jgi:hypothetical protein